MSGNTGSIIGTLTEEVADDYDPQELGNCTWFSAGGWDIVYALDLSPGENITATLTSLGAADTVLYLVEACPFTGDVCVAGDDSFTTTVPETFSYTYTGATEKTFFLVVDEYAFGNPDGGDFELAWTIF